MNRMSASPRQMFNREFKNLSAITWAHAVNSQAELSNVLSSEYNINALIAQ